MCLYESCEKNPPLPRPPHSASFPMKQQLKLLNLLTGFRCHSTAARVVCAAPVSVISCSLRQDSINKAAAAAGHTAPDRHEPGHNGLVLGFSLLHRVGLGFTGLSIWGLVLLFFFFLFLQAQKMLFAS